MGFPTKKWSFWGVLGVPPFKETPMCETSVLKFQSIFFDFWEVRISMEQWVAKNPKRFSPKRRHEISPQKPPWVITVHLRASPQNNTYRTSESLPKIHWSYIFSCRDPLRELFGGWSWCLKSFSPNNLVSHHMGVSLNGGTPHPKMIIFGRKTHGVVGETHHFRKPPYIFLPAFLKKIAAWLGKVFSEPNSWTPGLLSTWRSRWQQLHAMWDPPPKKMMTWIQNG